MFTKFLLYGSLLIIPQCITEGQVEMIIQTGETEYQLKNSEASREDHLISLQRQIQDLENIIQVRQEIRIKNQRIKILEKHAEHQKQRYIQEIRRLQEKNTSLKQIIHDSSAHISRMGQVKARKYELIAAKDKEIHSLKQQLHHLMEQSNKDDTSSQVNIEVLRSTSQDSAINLSANLLPTYPPVHKFQIE